MTLNQLASLICKREGKKHQASVGDVREILKIIVELELDDCEENGLDEENGPLSCLSAAYNSASKKKPSKKKAKKK